MYSVCFKKDLAKRFHPSKFDILRFPVPAGCQSGQFSNRKTVPFWPSFIQEFRVQRLEIECKSERAFLALPYALNRSEDLREPMLIRGKMHGNRRFENFGAK